MTAHKHLTALAESLRQAVGFRWRAVLTIGPFVVGYARRALESSTPIVLPDLVFTLVGVVISFCVLSYLVLSYATRLRMRTIPKMKVYLDPKTNGILTIPSINKETKERVSTNWIQLTVKADLDTALSYWQKLVTV